MRAKLAWGLALMSIVGGSVHGAQAPDAASYPSKPIRLIVPQAPGGLDGKSFLPLLKGGAGPDREYLYWEFPSGGGQQAVRMGKWQGLRQDLNKGKAPLKVFDLASDPGEAKDVAAEHPDIVDKMEKILADNHRRSDLFPIKGLDAK